MSKSKRFFSIEVAEKRELTLHNVSREFSAQRSERRDIVALVCSSPIEDVSPITRTAVVKVRTSRWEHRLEHSSNSPMTNSNEISFDIADLTQSTAIEDQGSFGIILTQLGCVGGRRSSAQLNGFLVQRMEKHIEVQCHVGENGLIHLLNDWNTFHRQETMKELKNVLNQLNEEEIESAQEERVTRLYRIGMKKTIGP